jgi:arylsulfatase A-like enzyme
MHRKASGRFLSALLRVAQRRLSHVKLNAMGRPPRVQLLAVCLLIAVPFVVAACVRTVTHDPDPNNPGAPTYDNVQLEGGGTFSTCNTANPATCSPDTSPNNAYSGSWVAKAGRPLNTAVSGRERGMGALSTNVPYGYEGWYAAAFFFPSGTLSGSDPSQQGGIDIMRWDNERTSASGQAADFGGIRIGADHRARLVRGTNDTASNVIGEKFALREGCWNWLAVKQKLGTDASAKNEVWLNGKKVIAADGTQNIADARGADDVKFGYNTIDSRQQKPLTYYMDDATIATSGENPTAPTGAGLCTPLPNILLIVTDDQRYLPPTILSAWMPNVATYFQQQGKTAPNAYVSSPECCPSRASILSGRYPHNTGIINAGLASYQLGDEGNVDSPYDPNGHFQSSTLEYYLKGLGYQTGIFGKYLNKWSLSRNPPWFDQWSISNTGAAYCNFEVNEQGADVTKSGTLGSDLNGPFCTPPEYSTTYFANKAQGFIQSTKATDGRPWFLYLAVHAPHATGELNGNTAYPGDNKFIPEQAHADALPVDLSPVYQETDVGDKPPYVQHSQLAASQAASNHPVPYDLPAYACCAFKPYPDSPTQQERRRDQLRTLMSVDDAVGQLFHTLQDPGIAEDSNTLSFFTSDNGYMWNENYIQGKLTPYTYSIRVPMLMRWPGGPVTAGGNEPRLLSNVDIAPTVADAVKPLISVDPNVPMDGRSLLDSTWTRQYLLSEYTRSSEADTPDVMAACELPSWNALRASHWQYTRYANISNDPGCHGGYSAPPFKEFYGEEAPPYSNEIMQMTNNLYGGDGDPSNNPGAPAPKDTELDAALTCKGQGQVPNPPGPNYPACP